MAGAGAPSPTDVAVAPPDDAGGLLDLSFDGANVAPSSDDADVCGTTAGDDEYRIDDYARVPPGGVDGGTKPAHGKGGIHGTEPGDGAAAVDDGIDGDNDVVSGDNEGKEERMDNRLRPGDHVYVWQSYGIDPRAYQRHAVVYSVEGRRRGGGGTPTNGGHPVDTDLAAERYDVTTTSLFDLDAQYADRDNGVDVTVVSFYQFIRHHAATGAASRATQAASGDSRGKRSGCRRESLLDFIGPDGVARRRLVPKVRYGRAVRRGLILPRAGVGTALKKDQPGLILARLRYLSENPDHLPDHSALSANGECASLWCITGRWCTLQGASILAVTSVGQAGGALLAGGILSNVLVPMPGLWGMAGWWWYAPATIAYPFLVPTLVTMGMASLVPLEILRRNRKRWKGITDGLNHEFWTITSDDVREEYFGMMATAEVKFV